MSGAIGSRTGLFTCRVQRRRAAQEGRKFAVQIKVIVVALRRYRFFFLDVEVRNVQMNYGLGMLLPVRYHGGIERKIIDFRHVRRGCYSGNRIGSACHRGFRGNRLGSGPCDRRPACRVLDRRRRNSGLWSQGRGNRSSRLWLLEHCVLVIQQDIGEIEFQILERELEIVIDRKFVYDCRFGRLG